MYVGCGAYIALSGGGGATATVPIVLPSLMCNSQNTTLVTVHSSSPANNQGSEENVGRGVKMCVMLLILVLYVQGYLLSRLSSRY